MNRPEMNREWSGNDCWLEWMKVGGENGPQDRWNVVSDVQEMVRKRPGDGLKWPGNGQEKDGLKW